MKAPPHFFALRKAALPHIESYHRDLLVHDRRMLRRWPDVPFIHSTRAWGSYMDMFYPPDHPIWPKDDATEVPYIFATANRRRILEQVGCCVEHTLLPQNNCHGLRAILLHYFDGKHLHLSNPKEIHQLVADYKRDTREAWRAAMPAYQRQWWPVAA